MLIAASVMNSVSAWPGTSMMKTWLIRRSVRRPVAEAVTSRISSSVCRLPFISSSPLPSRISATALAAAAWLCGGVDDLAAGQVDAVLAATSRIFASARRGPARSAARRGVDRAPQRGLVAGMRDDGHGRGAVAGAARSAGRISRVSAWYRAHWPPVRMPCDRCRAPRGTRVTGSVSRPNSVATSPSRLVAASSSAPLAASTSLSVSNAARRSSAEFGHQTGDRRQRGVLGR